MALEQAAAAVDGGRVLRLATELSFPRYPGSEGDARAIAQVKAELATTTNLEVEVEPFSYDLTPAWRALRAVLVWSALLLGAAGWLAATRPMVAAALLVAAVLPSAVFLAWAPGLERLYRRAGAVETANVVARRRAASPRLMLIVMAHHDSKSQNLTLPWRLGLTLTAIGGALGLAVLLVVGDGADWLPRACGGLGMVALLVLSTLRSGNASPGAVDNAGSLAILLELARVLPRRLPADVELVFLSPGAEEDHMVGAMRWLDRHSTELARAPAFTLNIDGAGNPGKVALLERYGFGRAFSPTLSRVVRRAATALGVELRGVLLPPGMGVDAIPFAHRGLEAITFSSGSLGRATLAVHSAGDRAEHLDAETLERVARLVEAVAVELASAER